MGNQLGFMSGSAIMLFFPCLNEFYLFLVGEFLRGSVISCGNAAEQNKSLKKKKDNDK